MRVFIRDNLVDLHVRASEAPWELQASDYTGLTKDQIRSRWRDPLFKGAFLHGFEGVTASVVVSQAASNRPRVMWCLIVDYDSAAITPETLAAMVAHPALEALQPAWSCWTSSGKGVRLIWDFEAPVTIANDAQAKAFLAQLAKRLALRSWLPGFDTATLNPYQDFELGSRWAPVSPQSQVPTLYLHQWLWEASQKLKLMPEGETPVNVPLDDVAREVEKRFPGRWHGEFREGARGVRFWDPTADNPTAAVVCPDGMLAFTGPQGFLSWRQIFGPEFTAAYAAKKIDALFSKVLWDEHQFWLLQDDGYWEKWNDSGFRSWLRCMGFNAKPDKAGGASEIDAAIVEVQARRRVRAALPFIYYPHGPMDYRSESVLNTSRITPVAPAEPLPADIAMRDVVRQFPFIWSFLSQFLELIEGEPEQLTYLLCWMKHFYESGLYKRPKPGHALVLSGEMSKGKTFFATALLAKLMGGSGDGSDYVVRGTQWSDQIAKWPVLVIDDPPGSVSQEDHQRFSALVKKMVANQCLSFNGKWMATGEVSWNGRVVLCCNDDPESLRMLPNLDHGTMDKISLLKVAAESRFVFPADREETQKRIAMELPYFARFLLDFEVPEDALDRQNTRYYLKPYRHPALVIAANRGGSAYQVFELLTTFLDDYAIEKPDAEFWEGSATQLFACLSAKSQFATMGRLTPRGLGIALGQLKARGVDLKSKSTSRNSQIWTIPVAIKWTDGTCGSRTNVRTSGAAVAPQLGDLKKESDDGQRNPEQSTRVGNPEAGSASEAPGAASRG